MTPEHDPPPDLSVIVPALDEADRIGALLDALARMPGRPEVIVVDGGSRDETVAEVPPDVLADLEALLS